MFFSHASLIKPKDFPSQDKFNLLKIIWFQQSSSDYSNDKIGSILKTLEFDLSTLESFKFWILNKIKIKL